MKNELSAEETLFRFWRNNVLHEFGYPNLRKVPRTLVCCWRKHCSTLVNNVWSGTANHLQREYSRSYLIKSWSHLVKQSWFTFTPKLVPEASSLSHLSRGVVPILNRLALPFIGDFCHFYQRPKTPPEIGELLLSLFSWFLEKLLLIRAPRLDRVVWVRVRGFPCRLHLSRAPRLERGCVG